MLAAIVLAAPASLHAAGAPASNPQPIVEVSAAQLLRFADKALAKGDVETAARAYRALMNDRTVDIRLEARFQLALIEAKRGNLATAAALLRQVVDERPSLLRPRLELAGVLDRMGDKDGAWRQLRAVHAAGLPLSVARLIDRYSEALRAQRPFGASFEIALAPDSNINRATRSDTLGTVFGDFDIDKDARAKSGTGLSLHAQVYRRLPLGERLSLLMRATAFADLYRDSRFNDIAADVAVGPEIQAGRDRIQLELGATQRWFGQKPFLRSVRLAGTYSHPLGRRALARLTGSAALVDNQLNDLQDGKTYSAQLEIERALSPTMGVTASLGVDRQSLRDPGYSTLGWRGGVGAWRDLGRTTVAARIDVGRLHADDRLALFPARREDRYSRFSIAATFRQLQFRGFAPLARFSIERNRSTVAFYDFRRTRTELGIVRAF